MATETISPLDPISIKPEKSRIHDEAATKSTSLSQSISFFPQNQNLTFNIFASANDQSDTKIAWCSRSSNVIRIISLNTNETYQPFNGPQLKCGSIFFIKPSTIFIIKAEILPSSSLSRVQIPCYQSTTITKLAKLTSRCFRWEFRAREFIHMELSMAEKVNAHSFRARELSLQRSRSRRYRLQWIPRDGRGAASAERDRISSFWLCWIENR